jgi:hypothetical protein
MNITILASGKPSLSKRFFKDGDVVRSKKAEMSSYFRFESREVDGIDEFSSLLAELEQDRSRFIIRGQLAEDVDTDKPMRRRLYRNDRSEPNESPRTRSIKKLKKALPIIKIQQAVLSKNSKGTTDNKNSAGPQVEI